jgi:mannose-6-phosphate isomerase-like protein (cupin superfamily)
MNEIKKIKKEWGEERWIINESYCGKILLLKRNFRCSLHFHKKKDEVFYVIRGKVLMELGNKKFIMNPEDSIRVLPNTLHRFTGLTDAQIIEFSSHHEDSDSYRKEISGKVNLFRAYDYDGVVSSGIEIEIGVPIITSRTIDEIEKINERIRKNHPIYFNPIGLNEKSLEKEIAWKAKMINLLGVEEYYEDTAKVVVGLSKLCPNCNIINFGKSKVKKFIS